MFFVFIIITSRDYFSMLTVIVHWRFQEFGFSSQKTCTPSVTKAVVTCGTNSTIVDTSGTAYCRVRPDENVNATVNLISSAGFNATTSISAGVVLSHKNYFINMNIFLLLHIFLIIVDALAAACLSKYYVWNL